LDPSPDPSPAICDAASALRCKTRGLERTYLYKSVIDAWEKLGLNQQKYNGIKQRLAHPRPTIRELSDTEDTNMNDEPGQRVRGRAEGQLRSSPAP
jgi:hypothetical protein